MGFPFFWSLLLLLVSLFLTNWLRPEYSFAADSLEQLVHAYSVLENGFRSFVFSCNWLLPFNSCELFPIKFIAKQDGFVSPFPYTIVLLKAFLLQFFPEVGIVFLGSILFSFGGFKILARENHHPKIIVILILFATPLFFHSIGFLDVALSNLFFLLGLMAWTKNPNKAWFGVLLGLSVAFRVETLLFSFPFLCFAFFQRKMRIAKALLSFAICLGIYFFGNKVFHETWLGERIHANQSGILNLFSLERLKIATSLLFYGEMRIGFFFYFPIAFWILALGIFSRRRNWVKTISCFILFNILVASLLAPNNSNIDWGTRYLSHLYFPLLWIGFRSFPNKRSMLHSGLIVFLLSISICFSMLYGKAAKVSANQIQKVQNSYLKGDPVYLIFNNRFLANHMGLKYKQYKFVLIPKSPSQTRYFWEAFRKIPQNIYFIDWVEGKELKEEVQLLFEQKEDIFFSLEKDVDSRMNRGLIYDNGNYRVFSLTPKR